MKEILIKSDSNNQRIDKFLAKGFFSFSRGEIIRNIKAGNILVDDKKVKPSYVLKVGDKISVNIQKKKEIISPNGNVKFKIIHEDKNVIIIDKPAGISVHPAELDDINTLANGLIYQFPEIKNVGDDPKFRPGIVHRLDRDTSGIMIIARNQKAFEALKNIFKKRNVEKKYWAIVYGKLDNKKGIIEKPIARSSSYKKQVIAGKKTKTVIRQAVTEYRLLKEFDGYSLVEVIPRTGRTHQIRVHMKSIGNSVVGDEKYKTKGKNIKKNSLAKRHMLHAKRIRFVLFEKRYDFSAEIPRDFLNIIGFLTKSR